MQLYQIPKEVSKSQQGSEVNKKGALNQK